MWANKGWGEKKTHSLETEQTNMRNKHSTSKTSDMK